MKLASMRYRLCRVSPVEQGLQRWAPKGELPKVFRLEPLVRVPAVWLICFLTKRKSRNRYAKTHKRLKTIRQFFSLIHDQSSFFAQKVN